MMNPKIIEHDEDVVILSMSEFNAMQERIKKLEAQNRLYHELNKPMLSAMNGSKGMTLSEFRERASAI